MPKINFKLGTSIKLKHQKSVVLKIVMNKIIQIAKRIQAIGREWKKNLKTQKTVDFYVKLKQ